VTRQTWTAFVSAFVFVGLAILLVVVPVPFVSWSPGGTRDTLGNAEEGGTLTRGVEQVEHLGRDGRIGSIVDRQCDLAPRSRYVRKACDVGAEQARSRQQHRRRDQHVIEHHGKQCP